MLWKFEKQNELFGKVLKYKHFLWVVFSILIILLSVLMIADKVLSKRRASAALLISSRPFLNFSNTAKEEDKERLMSFQADMTRAFHKRFLESPLLLERAYIRLKQDDDSLARVKFLNVNIEKISRDQALLRLSLEHKNPVLFLNTLVELYLEEYFESRIKEEQNFLEKIHEKLASLEDVIASQEIALFEMDQTRSNDREDSEPEKLTQYFRSLRDVREKLPKAISDEDMASKIESEQSVSDFTLSQRLLTYKKLHDDLRVLSKKYKSEHPEIRNLRHQIAGERNRFREQKAKLKREEETLLGMIASLRKRMPLSFRHENKPDVSLVRSLEVNKKLYGQLNERAQKILSGQFLHNTDIQVLNLAQLSASPRFTFSSVIKGLCGTAVCVLLVVLGVVHGVEIYEKRKLKEKHTAKLNFITLGNFPSFSIKEKLKQPLHLLLDQNPDHPFCAEIKRMTNELLIQTQSKNVKSVLFTHVGPEARKINVISNLGVSLVHKNKRVLLVDASWLNPQLGTIFALENSVGLLNVLLGQAKISEAIQTTEIPNLDILPAGPHLPKNFELLAAPSMKIVLDELESLYDFVFIEAPSCFEHGDIYTLAQYVQGVILVQDSREKIKSMLAYKSGVSREDVESLSWIGKVNLSQRII